MRLSICSLLGSMYSIVTVNIYSLKNLSVEYPWMAWIPVLSVFNLVKIAGLSYWWVLGLFIPLWNIYAIIKIYHNISLRTGHGGWWTVGMIFSSPIFIPVTAFHYQHWDEENPRPFTGWKKILLILAWSLFVLIIPLGIIAASLSAGLTWYNQRSLDISRSAHMSSITTTLLTYYSDTEKYPNMPKSWCISDVTEDLSIYLAWRPIPADPIKGHINTGCVNPGSYAYRTFKDSKWDAQFAISATMVNEVGGNSSKSLDEYTDSELSNTTLSRWAWKYYILTSIR